MRFFVVLFFHVFGRVQRDRQPRTMIVALNGSRTWMKTDRIGYTRNMVTDPTSWMGA